MFDIIAEGGIYMGPLLLASALAIAVGLERAVYFSRLAPGDASFRAELAKLLGQSDLEGAARLAEGDGPARACARAAVENWSGSLEVVETAMSQQAREYEPALHRFLGMLETIVTAAPLIGLLGTITGMMGVFRSVAERLANDPQANTSGITAGIGEALIATATGILVAVVALIIHNIFQAMAEARMVESEQTAEAIRLAHVKKA